MSLGNQSSTLTTSLIYLQLVNTVSGLSSTTPGKFSISLMVSPSMEVQQQIKTISIFLVKEVDSLLEIRVHIQKSNANSIQYQIITSRKTLLLKFMGSIHHRELLVVRRLQRYVCHILDSEMQTFSLPLNCEFKLSKKPLEKDQKRSFFITSYLMELL